MDDFRRDVEAAMKEQEEGDGAGEERYLVQAGAFRNKENAERLAERLRAAGFEAFVKS